MPGQSVMQYGSKRHAPSSTAQAEKIAGTPRRECQRITSASYEA